jgi:uncharacterized protein with gpF-like domain
MGLYEAVASVAGARLIDQLGVKFSINDTYMREFIHQRSNTLARIITDTTYGQVQDTMWAGARAGESAEEIAARVTEVFAKAGTNRAGLIAQTECLSAWNGTTNLVGRNAPISLVAAQEWITKRDIKVRLAHRQADGQLAGIGDKFIVEGEALAYPGDPVGSPDNICNCRCVLNLLSPDEVTQRRAALQYRRVEEVEADLVRLAATGAMA